MDTNTTNINLSNHGKIWEVEHDEHLRHLFDSGVVELPEMAERLGRTVYAVVQRLCDLKILFFMSNDNCYYTQPQQWLSVHQISKLHKEQYE